MFTIMQFPALLALFCKILFLMVTDTTLFGF